MFKQENYVRSQPARARNLDGPEKVLKQLALMDAAASSISDGDLVDSLIHGYVPEYSATDSVLSNPWKTGTALELDAATCHSFYD